MEDMYVEFRYSLDGHKFISRGCVCYWTNDWYMSRSNIWCCGVAIAGVYIGPIDATYIVTTMGVYIEAIVGV